MKLLPTNIYKIVIIAAIVLCAASLSFAQERGGEEARVSPNATVSQTIGTTDLTITYGRPAVNDREIFGSGLVPYGKVWRTGANESTALVVSDEITIEGHNLKAGTYSLYTIPRENEWTIIINSKLSWGTQYDENADVIRFNVKPQNADFIERMMFYFTDIEEESATIVLWWDDVKVPFTIKT